MKRTSVQWTVVQVQQLRQECVGVSLLSKQWWSCLGVTKTFWWPAGKKICKEWKTVLGWLFFFFSLSLSLSLCRPLSQASSFDLTLTSTQILAPYKQLCKTACSTGHASVASVRSRCQRRSWLGFGQNKSSHQSSWQVFHVPPSHGATTAHGMLARRWFVWQCRHAGGPKPFHIAIMCQLMKRTWSSCDTLTHLHHLSPLSLQSHDEQNV